MDRIGPRIDWTEFDSGGWKWSPDLGAEFGRGEIARDIPRKIWARDLGADLGACLGADLGAKFGRSFGLLSSTSSNNLGAGFWARIWARVWARNSGARFALQHSKAHCTDGMQWRYGQC